MGGTGNWLPFLGVLLGGCAVVKTADWLAKYVALRRKRELMRMEHTIISDLFDDISAN